MPNRRHDFTIHPCIWSREWDFPGYSFTNPNQAPAPQQSTVLPAGWTSLNHLLYDIDITTGSPLSEAHRQYKPVSASGTYRLQQINDSLNTLSATLDADATTINHTAVYLEDNHGNFYLFALGTSQLVPSRNQRSTGPVSYRFRGALSPLLSSQRNTLIGFAAELAQALSPNGWEQRNRYQRLDRFSEAAALALQSKQINTTRLKGQLSTLLAQAPPVFNSHIFETPQGRTRISELPVPGAATSKRNEPSLRWDALASSVGFTPALVRNRAHMTNLALTESRTPDVATNGFFITLGPLDSESGLYNRERTQINKYYTAPTDNTPLPQTLELQSLSVTVTNQQRYSDTFPIRQQLPGVVTPNRPFPLGYAYIGYNDSTNMRVNAAVNFYHILHVTGSTVELEVGVADDNVPPGLTASFTFNARTNSQPPNPVQSDPDQLVLQNSPSVLRYDRHDMAVLPVLRLSATTELLFLDSFHKPPLTANLRLHFRKQRPTNADTAFLKLTAGDTLGDAIWMTISPDEDQRNWQIMSKRLVKPFNKTPYMDTQLLAIPD